MKIKCLSCGHRMDLDDAYDNYEGQVECSSCSAILKIKTEKGGIYSVALMTFSPHQPPEETFFPLIERLESEK